MSKTVFLAGATGVIGLPLSKVLVAKGYKVYGTTRSEAKAEKLTAIGVTPVIVDAFDAEKMKAAMVEIQPQIVLHQLTDLPDNLNPDEMEAGLKRNARILDEGTRNLVAAAEAAGVEKVVAQSICFVYEPTEQFPQDETSPLLNFDDAVYGETARAVHSLEQQVLNGRFQGVVLRNGLLYGENTGFDSAVDFVPPVHVEAAVQAIVLAMESDKTGVFNIADDDVRLSSKKAKHELKWSPELRV